MMTRQDPERDDKAAPRSRLRALLSFGAEKQTLAHALLFALSVLVPFSMGVRECERVPIGDDCDGGTGKGCSCEYNGTSYKSGDSFKSDDGCNDCGCTDGQVACTLKACLQTCGGLAGLQCGDKQYCQFAPDAACGAADRTGICQAIPEVCPEYFSPVCGCDDKTYENSCKAAAAGVSVVSEKECGAASGGTCEYEGKTYKVGESYPAADGCNQCSCQDDGSSACTLIGCPEKQLCGSRGLPACADGQYCNFPTTSQCGAADGPGYCAELPGACTKEYKPVCGCDDQTYGNDCTAAAAGISVLHDGECKPSSGDAGCDYEGQHYSVGDAFPSSDGCNSCSCTEGGNVACTLRACAPASICGGLQGLQCEKGQYCDFALDAICGAADQTGTCKPIPDVCDLALDPVCGCDDKTYDNACKANSAGISVSAKGECGAAAGGCDYQRQHYNVGDTFPSSDGCNSCGCQEDGSVVCTEKACAPEGKVCGGFAGFTCGDKEYCAFTADAICGIADATGVCKARPEVCTDIYKPVCGCDSNTYPNECSANVAGTSARVDGECK